MINRDGKRFYAQKLQSNQSTNHRKIRIALISTYLIGIERIYFFKDDGTLWWDIAYSHEALMSMFIKVVEKYSSSMVCFFLDFVQNEYKDFSPEIQYSSGE